MAALSPVTIDIWRRDRDRRRATRRSGFANSAKKNRFSGAESTPLSLRGEPRVKTITRTSRFNFEVLRLVAAQFCQPRVATLGGIFTRS
jgi:hypothetical protein